MTIVGLARDPQVSYWTRNFPLRLTSIASLVTASTSYVSSALLLALFQLALPLPLFTLLSQIALTVVYVFIQRSAARLIGQIPKSGHVTGYMLEDLRWLPVR